MMIAVVGSGGKTTWIHRLAERFRNDGKRVLVATTTHMRIEPDTLLTDDADEIIRQLELKGYAMAGQKDGEKIRSLSPDTFQSVCRYADMVLVEADGSRNLPLKVPDKTEPVIPNDADAIVIVCGLRALERPAFETVHRLELSDIAPTEMITLQHIQKLVREGYVKRLKKQYPEKIIEIHPVHDGSLYQRAAASLIASDMDVSLIRKEWFTNRPKLLICGGGHVAQKTAAIAVQAGFCVHVLEERPEFANRDCFPDVETVVCDSYENLERYIEPGCFSVILTGGHGSDLNCLRILLQQDCRYLGMIGSRKKVRNSFDVLSKEGCTEEQLASVHAPIGVDIGAETPAEIAVSIVAELIQVKNRLSSASASEELLSTDEHGMLCIIVEKSGSTPRGEGSMMLVTENAVVDSIGGGPIEAAAIRDARTHPEPAIRRYRLGDGEGARLGMICGGSNTVLFLPI